MILIAASRPSNPDVSVFDIESGIYIAEYGLIGFDDSFQVNIDKEIVRVDMLLDKAFDLEERRKKVPFVLGVVSTLGRRPGSDCNPGNTVLCGQA